jgi:hypothetical protein
MASTMPPTSPTSLAASFSVTMMSSTASFISWAASVMASWVCCAWEGIVRCFLTQNKMMLVLKNHFVSLKNNPKKRVWWPGAVGHRLDL